MTIMAPALFSCTQAMTIYGALAKASPKAAPEAAEEKSGEEFASPQ